MFTDSTYFNESDVTHIPVDKLYTEANTLTSVKSEVTDNAVDTPFTDSKHFHKSGSSSSAKDTMFNDNKHFDKSKVNDSAVDT